MKKRVLSALLVLCMACSMVSTVWAANEQATPETADEPASVLLDDSQSAPVTNAPAQDQDVAEGLTAPEDEESGQQSDVDTPDASQPEQAESTGTPVDGGIEYTAALEQDGQALNVIVTAPEGAFDEGVEPKLSVSAIEGETALDTIASKLEGNVEYDGFAALDISFKNEAGEEIEPKVPVTVRIELPDSIVDSGIDLSTLAVQHLAEDEAGNVTAVEQVASVADGTITLSDAAKAAMEAQAAEDAAAANGIAPMSNAPAANNALTPDAATTEAAAVAEFEVSGFSSFTIIWNDRDNNTSTSINVVLWDATNDEELPYNGNINEFNEQLQNNGSFTFTSEAVPSIEGYTFAYAEYGWDYGYWNGNSVTTIAAENQRYWSPGILGWGSGWRNKWVYKADGQEINGTPAIRLFYTPEGGSEDPGQSEKPEPGHEKTVTWNENDGAYDLTLSVNGTVGSQTVPAVVDVLMIVDTSGSMNDYGRMTATKNAMKALVNTLEQKDNVDVRYNIIEFAKDASNVTQNQQTNGWITNNNGAVTNAINRLSAGGGTNYEAGLQLAIRKLDDARPTAQTVVIFLSDGVPTYSLDGGDGSTGLLEWYHPLYGDAYQPYKEYWDDTLETASGLTCDQFYTIGISGRSAEEDMDQYLDNSETGLLSAVNSETTADNYKVANYDGSNLTTIFNDIAESAVELNVTNVKISDTLSSYVEPVLGSNGNPQKLQVIIEDSEGHAVSNIFGITANYNSATKELTLNFPQDYPLNSDYTYKVVMSILPNGAAELCYAQNGEYLPGMEGEEGTGDHENDAGFFSNASRAELTYRYPGDTEDRSAEYKMPVVQVKKSYLVLGKALGEDTESNPDQKFTFEIGIPTEGTYSAVYTENPDEVTALEFKKAAGQTNATATVTLAANEQVYIVLPTGTTATIKETSTEGFTQTWYKGETELTAAEDGSITENLPNTAGQTTTITCVNTAESVTGNLTITKSVQGIDNVDSAIYQNTTFTFAIEKLIRNADGTYTVDTAFTDTTLGFAAGQKTVTITGASSSDIEGLPVGWYRVRETNPGTLTGDNDYEYVRNNGPVVVEVKANSDSSAQAPITNTYQHKAKTLTVIKTITGNMAYDQDTFQFTFALQKDGEPYELTGELPNGVTKVEGADGQYTFSLKAAAGSNQMEFTLPYGATATVTETLTEEYEETSRQYKTGSEELPAFGNDNTEEAVMNDNMTFEFQNKKEIVTPPTGLDRNDTPYALMITAAGIAGLALIGAVVNRRIRRRRED